MVRYERLARVDLNVTDLERSARFYEETVGLQRVGTDEIDGSVVVHKVLRNNDHARSKAQREKGQ